MPFYITLFKYTEQGVKNIKESPQRVASFKAEVEKAGGKVIGFYYTFGEYDGVTIIEGSNDEAVMAVLIGVGRAGNVHTKTLKAFSEAEATKLIESLP
ncbi:GYD domain-containing protein [[Eubacterium] cellulosolvens]